MSTFTKAELMQFLDMVISKGWVNTNTGNSWRAAVKKILGDLPDDTDVREVDLKVELLRYNNLNPGQLAPDSLRVYEQRAGIGIQQFIQYKTDPSKYKPPGRGLNGLKGDKSERPATLAKAKGISPSASESRPDAASQAGHGSGHVQMRPMAVTASGFASDLNLAMPFPLRANYLAQVVIPRDLTREEADRLCAFIQALAQAK